MNNLLLNYFKSLTVEKWTVLSFFVVGYFLIYKYSFYSQLGIPWYISNISPLQVIFGSVKIVIYVFIAFTLSYVIIFCLRHFVKNFLFSCLLQVAVVLLLVYLIVFLVFEPILVLKFNSLEVLSGFEYVQIIILFMFIFLLVDLSLMLYELEHKSDINVENILNKLNPLDLELSSNDIKQNEILKEIGGYVLKETKMAKVMISFMILFSLFVSFVVGGTDANHFFKHNNNYIEIKGDVSKWLVVDYIGDKILIVKKSENVVIRNFKIIEYKEVVNIITKKEVSKFDESFNGKIKDILGISE